MFNLFQNIIKRIFLGPFVRATYSLEGEDLILRNLFQDAKKGYYVDVGAFHPVRFSNTYLLYRRGWRGINLEARPGSKKLFDRVRPGDINLEIAVANGEKTLTYLMFQEPALNGFAEGKMEEREGDAKPIERRKIKTAKLAQILDQNLPSGQKIDLLSVDVEGWEIEVLKSNDWDKYRPQILLVEILGGVDIESIVRTEVYKFLIDRGYKMISRLRHTCIFRDGQFPLSS